MSIILYIFCLAISFVFAYFMPRFHGRWQADLFSLLILFGLIGAWVMADELFSRQFLTGVTLVFDVFGITVCLWRGDQSTTAVQARSNN